MSWIAILVVIVGIYLAIKVVGFMFKLAMWALVIGGLYWLAAPYLGLPLPV
ncbi:hypothetical protein [Arenimonas oryziterrae]|uniref:Uncharacterized protein n=1 Tax=Arenimonas oryziterrae DSM 21050 = YC6267 TaxID=1121015 RepID=A0A091AWX2_9GAMM|nr:hypothetical protein [Arenimonas oryziterrae]KFN44793.1 hypothetical protein N789_01910 [Arenimonas oryziterrae DSM 21050 = YC6267]